MTVWVEDALWPRGKYVCGHLFADDLEQLHAIALGAGLARKYFLSHAVVPHYSIPEHSIEGAVAAGAVKISREQRQEYLMRAFRATSAHTVGKEARGFDPIPRKRKQQETLFG